MRPVGSHGIGRSYSTQGNSTFIRTFISHYTDRLHRKQDNSRLPNLMIKHRFISVGILHLPVAQALNENIVGFLQGLYGTGLILIIVFVVRSLPTGTRSGISALRQIDKSIEESAYDMGADSFKVFMTVTLPLIKDSFLSGLVTAFVRSITAISAIILLVTPQFLLITVQINEFAEKGSYSLACAFATILIVITYGAVLLMNLFMNHFGTSKKMKEN